MANGQPRRDRHGRRLAARIVGGVSPWVEVIQPDYSAQAPSGDDERSAHYILLDRQLDARVRGQEQYQHYAVRLVSDAGAIDLAAIACP